jgi:hypothetical protein
MGNRIFLAAGSMTGCLSNKMASGRITSECTAGANGGMQLQVIDEKLNR